MKIAADISRTYFSMTSLHGLKYLMESGRPKYEKVFWLAALGAWWFVAVVMIYLVFHHWAASPVLVSFESEPLPITEIPFPAISICNMNKVYKSV